MRHLQTWFAAPFVACSLGTHRRLPLYSTAEPLAPSPHPAAPPLCPNRRQASSEQLRSTRETPQPLLNPAAAPYSLSPPHLHRENPNRAAPVISASEPNSRKPLHHSQIPLATSSSGQPQTHFATVPSLCASALSSPRAPLPHRRPSPWTDQHEPPLLQPFAL